MKSSSLLLRSMVLCGVLALPMIAQAGVSLDINVPGVSLHLGDQDKRGYYWDGYDWRPPQWWHEHKNKHIGDRNERGLYWNGGGWQPHRPPQRNAAPHAPQHDNGPRGHDKPGNDHPGNPGKGNKGDRGNHGGDDHRGGNGRPVPPQENGPRH
ncbi:DUF2502 domain-containing protein [Chimaeribacter arupi]|uniref:DUF2502 domain-containing protein n=1 Tax=Chimaeribacter arupi TaxID=2060066 RepID=UPI002711F5C3|nr:DUF2502 domain-containing protein [Chimaeribacter arupi]WKZ90915.1 DUF2502 domain-containing protein [Chimaeribacter arupi]